MDTGEAIKKLRKEHHQTQAELGKILGVASTTVSSWERGAAFPLMTTAKAMAELWNVPITVIAGDAPLENRPKQRVDIADDDVIMTFEGKPIPPEDVELMRRLLRGGKK
ncbi:helix-turn-helix transcriptional regulator [Lacticaseibacillus pabuli]|uniref:Helix-turn-helix transcriptional regulator n=1 Tax=Lacticaseibacillus pabuli TaxID=3025672 RepID=A0ABY7WVC2_9LACO|nr:helix-turn-helix transcriptional regulator [Lacticaseibacillus sp. KACC 23028]WDF81865.1 helix-turn-helix transcriptional regulator [Lacticaseibacillus sp. KACC 23028]